MAIILFKRMSKTIVLFFALTVSLNAFSQKSVKQIKRNQSAYIPKGAGDAMVQPLYFQSKKPYISLPQSGASIGGRNYAVEQTTYVNSDNNSEVLQQQEKVDLSQTISLNTVTVEMKSTFTPERDGKIDVDFYIKVPKEVIDPNYSIKLQPVIVTESGKVDLESVVVKGQQFALKQKIDYQSYEDFLNSIVPKEDYSKVFLDYEGIEADIKVRQQFYYQEYQEKWALHREYEDWLAEQEASKAEMIAKLKGEIAEIKADYRRNLLSHSAQDLAKGIDTTGLAASYDVAFLNKTKGKRAQLDKIIEQEIRVPKKYQEVHAMPINSQNIQNIYMTTQDTIDIVNSRYMTDKILENEQKMARKDQVKKEMIVFPYDESARLDTTIFTGNDFIYMYKQKIPVVPGMNKASIFMDTEIVALDESRFQIPAIDTLTYHISSIAQLVDTELLNKETVRNRNVANRMTVNIDYRPNTWRFDPRHQNNSAELDKIKETYKVFNESKTIELDSILIRNATDLTGQWTANYELSEKRAKDLARYLGSDASMNKRGTSFYKTKWLGENWNLLVKEIQANNKLTNKAEVLDIIGNTLNPEDSKKEIQTKYPDDFAIIKSEIYPKLGVTDIIFYGHRTDMATDTEVVKVDPEYKKGVALLQERKYAEALEILANYPDYNAAVALAALGYNGKAYDVLNKQKPNANVEYLSAVVATRLGQDQAAINHLLKSVKMDSGMMYRINLDPDIITLVEKYNLMDQLKDASGE